jgi:hypothetical protein
MKHIVLIVIIFSTIFPKQMIAQQKNDSCCLSMKNIIGTWQEDSPIVGSGLNQNFEFFSNGTFILHLGNSGDDVRGINTLKGKYRLDKDKLFFTITSKTIVEGKIGMADGGISLSLFEIEDGKEKEIQETNPKELTDPCYITLFSDRHIKLGNKVYYKLK